MKKQWYLQRATDEENPSPFWDSYVHHMCEVLETTDKKPFGKPIEYFDLNKLNHEIGYINGKEILKFFGVTSETIKVWMDNKNFPKPISITPKTRLWKCSHIKEWISEQK